jgi:hypothetical protein
MPRTIAAKANPMSRPLMLAGLAAGRLTGAAGFAAGAAGAAGLAAGAAEWDAAGAAAAAAAGAGTAGEAGADTGAGAGAAATGTRIDGPPAGFGGRLIRTVCFFWADASAGFWGSAVAGGLTGGVVSDIGFTSKR